MWAAPLDLPIRPMSPELSRISHSAASTLHSTERRSSPIAFVALHAGAGYLHPSNHPIIRSLLQSACNTALRQATTVEEAVAIAVSVLESSPLTNAALGSCLTEEGKVECEASIVFGNGSFGSVGAVTGVDHPIQVAYRLAADRDQHGLIKELSRVRPISLVGEGAYRFALRNGLGVALKPDVDQHHVTDKTRAAWQRYRDLIAAHAQRSQEQQEGAERAMRTDALKRPRTESDHVDSVTTPAPAVVAGVVAEPQGDSPSSTPDTVGAIACDWLGRVCAASSSGGIWMKHPGRLGSSSMPGSGCYSENFDDSVHPDDADTNPDELVSVAAAISGCGESIMEQFVALRCCELMKERIRSSGALSHELSPPVLSEVMQPLMKQRQALSIGDPQRTRKRRRNRVGEGQDSLQEDDGLSTGIVALTAVPTNRRSSSAAAEAGAEQRHLSLRFCWAHTAQHFALGYAGDEAGSGLTYKGEAWVSVLDNHSMETGRAEGGRAAPVVADRWSERRHRRRIVRPAK